MNIRVRRNKLKSFTTIITSETGIKQEIDKLFQGSKKGDNNDNTDENNSDVDDMDSINDTNRHNNWKAIPEQLVKDN